MGCAQKQIPNGIWRDTYTYVLVSSSPTAVAVGRPELPPLYHSWLRPLTASACRRTAPASKHSRARTVAVTSGCGAGPGDRRRAARGCTPRRRSRGVRAGRRPWPDRWWWCGQSLCGEAPLGAPVASCTTETANQLPVAAVLCRCECESTLPPPAPPPLAPPRVARWPAP